MKPISIVVRLFVFAIISASSFALIFAQDELAKDATWELPDVDKIRMEFSVWLDEVDADQETRAQVELAISQKFAADSKAERLDSILNIFAIEVDDILPVLDAMVRESKIDLLLAHQRIAGGQSPQVVKDHVSLIVSRWLAQHDLYDEALAMMAQEGLNVTELLDPATLLFYRGLAQHQLLQQDESISTLTRLLENELLIPKRYSVVARLMTADIEQMEENSLDEVARMMADIKRRQKLYRSGSRVRSEEEEVIRKLDKIIEDIEKQQQQMATSSLTPSSPMQDSQNASGLGAGDVTNRRENDGADWGNLPPAERSAALAEMAKDLPPHYRSVIEEYFRKLADDDQQP